MEDLIERVMVWNAYPEQTPAWSGFEYVPRNNRALKKLCEYVSYSWWEGVEFGCLQIDSGKYKVCIDLNVWEVTEKEFKVFLEKLAKDLETK